MTRASLAVLAVTLAACSSKAPAPQAAASAPPLPDDVKALAAAQPTPGSPAPGSGTLELTGEFVSPMRSELVVRWPGRVGKVLVDEGSAVRAGQPLLELETDYLSLDVQRAQAEAERAAAALSEAERDYARKQELLAKGSVTQAIHDRSRSGFDQARAGKSAADAALALARRRLADAVLLAPFDGVIAERHTDVGERLSDNTVAFVLVQASPLKLRVRVPERYLAAARPGLTVTARVDPYPDQTFQGQVSVVGRAIDPATRTFLLEAEFPNRDLRLKPGLFARVQADGIQG